MRQLKFRAWNGHAMFYEDWNDSGNVFLTAKDFLGRDDLEVMQFTGLKDVKGVEIYEGDIIQSTFNPNLLHVIRWVDDEGGFGAENPELVGVLGGSAGIKQEWLTTCEKCIVGNIYENADLLSTATGTENAATISDPASGHGEAA